MSTTNLPAPLPNEDPRAYAYRACSEIGALSFFSTARDFYVAEAAKYANRVLTDEEKIAANDVRNNIITQQGAVDAAWRFEQIVETPEGYKVN
jgi:hypothetical protein